MAAAMPAVTRDLPVLVIGLARTGVAVDALSRRRGRARARRRPPPGGRARRRRSGELASLAELVLGADDPAALDGIALVVPSPGVPADGAAARRRPSRAAFRS